MQKNCYSIAMGKIRCLAFIFIFSFFISSSAQEQVGRPLINHYTYQEYGGSPVNWWALEGDNGFMYFANQGKVLQFDGVNWEPVEIPGSSVRCLVKDDNGVIHVGGSSELGYLEPSETGILKFVSLLDKITEEHRSFGEVWDVTYDEGRVRSRMIVMHILCRRSTVM